MPVSIFLILTILFFTPADSFAMHIGERILPASWCGVWYAVSAPFVMYGLYRLKKAGPDAGMKPLVGMVGAAVFVISCMPIPVPFIGTCSHPAGTAMAAILIGPVLSVLSAAAALLLQALFLSHGGITTWGANIFSMGIVGSFSGYAVFKGLRSAGAPIGVAAFFAGVTGDWATYAAASVELAAGVAPPGAFVQTLTAVAVAFVPTQLPLGILEGFMTAGAVKFIMDRRPELFAAKPADGARA